LDVDKNNSLDYQEMQAGLFKLGYANSIRFSREDWDAFTHNGLERSA
jgi:hypothetical protein